MSIPYNACNLPASAIFPTLLFGKKRRRGVYQRYAFVMGISIFSMRSLCILILFSDFIRKVSNFKNYKACFKREYNSLPRCVC